MNYRILCTIGLLAASVTFAACDETVGGGDDEGCASNDDCETGEVCDLSDMEGSGDEATGMCVPEDVTGGCETDDECSDGYTCDTDAGECRSSCEAETDCVSGYFCGDENMCVEMQYIYVAIISETSADADINDTTTPGPDIDAIELSSGGDVFYAETVEAFLQGAGGDGGTTNNFSDVNAILGANDAIPTDGGECNLDNTTPQFWSMGDVSGFVIASFPTQRPLADGDIITIYELDDVICTNVETVRADAYEVFIGVNTLTASEITSAGNIGDSQWLSLGASSGNGGMTSYTVALP